MKKILLLFVLFFNLIPEVRDDGFSFFLTSSYAQNFGGEDELCDDVTTELATIDGCFEVWYELTITTVCETGEYVDQSGTDIYVLIPGCETDPEWPEDKDCNGDVNGSAYMAACGCIGGNTGIYECPPEETDCNGDVNGSAYMADCGCIGGNTGIYECPQPQTDCNGDVGGTAYLDACGTCVGGNTGKVAKVWFQDLDGDGWGNTAVAKSCYEPGAGWVLKPGDFNDNCANPANIKEQCTVCDPGSPLYNPVICACPCLKNLPATATGGVLRNYNGDIIRALGPSQNFTIQGNDYLGYSFTGRTDLIYTANGGGVPVQVITGVSVNGVDRPDYVDNMNYNCLGWALGDGKFAINATDVNDPADANTIAINNILGVNSIADAETNNVFRTDFDNIQVGQVLLILSGNSAGYVHAAVYEGNGEYSTKNGMGGGGDGLLRLSLAQIQNIYYHPEMGGAVSVFTNAPPKHNSSSNLGIGTNGTTSLPNATTATTIGCDCGTGH